MSEAVWRKSFFFIVTVIAGPVVGYGIAWHPELLGLNMATFWSLGGADPPGSSSRRPGLHSQVPYLVGDIAGLRPRNRRSTFCLADAKGDPLEESAATCRRSCGGGGAVVPHRQRQPGQGSSAEANRHQPQR